MTIPDLSVDLDIYENKIQLVFASTLYTEGLATHTPFNLSVVWSLPNESSVKLTKDNFYHWQ